MSILHAHHDTNIGWKIQQSNGCFEFKEPSSQRIQQPVQFSDSVQSSNYMVLKRESNPPAQTGTSRNNQKQHSLTQQKVAHTWWSKWHLWPEYYIWNVQAQRFADPFAIVFIPRLTIQITPNLLRLVRTPDFPHSFLPNQAFLGHLHFIVCPL